MGLTGKYKLEGMQDVGAATLIAALAASNPVIAKILNLAVVKTLVKLLINFLANKGLVILNIGAYYVEGKLDEKALVKALESGINEVDSKVLTPEESKRIDDEVIKAARKALPYNRKSRT